VHRERVASKSVLSYRMNSARRNSATRTSNTVTNRIALLVIGAYATAFSVLYWHSKEPRSWVPIILLTPIIIAVASFPIASLPGLQFNPSTEISQGGIPRDINR
jgi:hypothetical protein